MFVNDRAPMTNEQVKLNLHIAREPEGHADSQSGDGDDQDSDVEAEREQIERAGPANAPHLCMHRLKKVYGHGASAKVAVRDLSVGVQMDECLCLLGANGAGKTSTMQILSGLVSASGGTARVAGKSIYSSLHDIFATLGVCWQADTLWDLLTAREHLLLACRLRAVPPPHSGVVDALLLDVGLLPWADKPVQVYSGGTRRKLCVALALVGDTTTLLLDEPSTGLDPVSKRLLWALLRRQGARRALLLSTHSMGEAEALSSRVAILRSGRLCCLGSVQHIKSKYGR